MEIILLDSNKEDRYTDFLLCNDKSTIYASIKYRDLLLSITNSVPFYLLCIENDNILGVLPSFIKFNEKYGNVLNSLPFYGSNPGIILNSSLDKKEITAVKKKLIEGFCQLALENKCVSATLRTNPFESDFDVYLSAMLPTFIDSRISMLSELPKASKTTGEDIQKNIGKARQNVRKAQNSNIAFFTSNSIVDLMFIHDTNKENMEALGSIPVEKRFFVEFYDILKYDEDYTLYVAEKDGLKIGGVLLMLFNKVVEYFIPVTKIEFRNLQPLSLLLFNAMKDLSNRGFKFWNWGGTTLPSMKGVYNFKKKWGGKEGEYWYFTKIYDKNITKLDKLTILNEYHNFFVLPFSALGNEI